MNIFSALLNQVNTEERISTRVGGTFNHKINCQPVAEAGEARMNFFDLANLLDNDGNLQNEMMVASVSISYSPGKIKLWLKPSLVRRHDAGHHPCPPWK